MFSAFEGLEGLADFQPADGHLGITIDKLDGAGHQSRTSGFTARTLTTDEIPDFLEQRTQAQCQLQVLVLSPITPGDPGRRLPVSLEVYNMIASKFSLPETMLSSLVVEGLLVTEFHAFDGGYGILNAQSGKALIVTFDPATEKTFGLVIGLHDLGVRTFSRELQHFQEALPRSVAIIACWLSVVTQIRGKKFAERAAAVSDIAHESSMHWSNTIGVRRKLSELDFEILTRKLTVLSNILIWDGCAIRSYQDLARRTLSGHNSWINPTLRHHLESTQNILRARLSTVTDSLNGISICSQEVQRRATVHLHTVYSLVSQRDNEINQAISVASRRIAEASQRDSATMKNLAIHTQQVAVRTYLDSANVRMMTLINLLTLPGVFTATFFSTDFFNFRPKKPEYVVSDWIWLYFVVTIALTGFLVLSWNVWVSRAERKGRTLLGVDTTNAEVEHHDIRHSTGESTRETLSHETSTTRAREAAQPYSWPPAIDESNLSNYRSLLDSTGLAFREEFLRPLSQTEAVDTLDVVPSVRSQDVSNGLIASVGR